MSLQNQFPLPMEEKSKIEASKPLNLWNKGPYNFLLQRTLNHFFNKKTSQRRSIIEESLQLQLPLISDEILLSLYRQTLDIYSQSCFSRYQNSGFQMTHYERTFQKTVEAIIDSNPELTNIEIYPSTKYNKFLYKNRKMAIGPYVPDFICVGLKSEGCSSVVFEVDGDSHVYKAEKDLQREKHLESLGILTLPIPNEKVSDVDHITKALLSLHRQRSGALDKQIMAHKRKIWCKSIVCNLSLHQIEDFVKKNHGVSLNLPSEATSIQKLPNCPRKILRELKLQR